MGKKFYIIASIYLIIALIVSIGLVVYEAYESHNWQLLAFIPFIVILWLLNVEYLAIDKEYNCYDC